MFLGFFTLALLFFATEMSFIDRETNSQVREDLRQLGQKHTAQYENILLVESRLTDSFDPLSETSRQIHELAGGVLAVKSADITPYRNENTGFLFPNQAEFYKIEGEIKRLTAHYKMLLQQEDELIVEFRQHYVKLGKDLWAFSGAGADLRDALEDNEQAFSIRTDVTLTTNAILLAYIDHQPHGAQAYLDRLADHDVPLGALVEKKLVFFLQQAKTIIGDVIRDRYLTEAIIDDGVVLHINKLHGAYQKQLELLLKDQTGFYIGLFFSSLFLVVYIASLMAYILNRARRTASAASAMKSDFLASMSHEIRTPMNGILGMTELLLDDGLNDRQRSRAEAVYHSADNLLAILNDILDFSKIESGKMEMDLTSFNLRRMAEEVTELFAAKAATQDVEILLDYHPDLPEQVTGVLVRISQVLTNFVSNAVKFTASGSIIVKIEPCPSEGENERDINVKISVQDTGMGIAEEKQAHIFEKFTQADASTTREFGGTGLGLAICQQLVEMLGGEIGLNSQEGEGSDFWFTTSLKIEKREHFVKVADRTVLVGSRVLIADGREKCRGIIRDWLVAEGMEVTVCADARTALEQLGQVAGGFKPFDIALFDQSLPDTDGLSLVRQIRQEAIFNHSELVMLAPVAAKDFETHCEGTGLAACIPKPVRRADLLDILAMIRRNILRNQQIKMITPHALAASRLQKARNPQTAFQDMQVLLVEDNKINQALIREMIEGFGCDVTLAENGRIALEKVSQANYSLIFMDCQMPEMDGFEATGEICKMKEAGTVEDIPIVALTANSMEGDRERCLKAGMQDYLSKPVSKSALHSIFMKWAPAGKRVYVKASQVEIHKTPNIVSDPKKEKIMEMNFDITAMNMDEVQEAKNILKARYPELVEGYLEDAASYVAAIEEGVAEESLDKIIHGAHPMKSSSAGLGITGVSQISRAIEEAAREGQAVEEIGAMIAPLKEALTYAEEKLREILDDVA